MKTLKSKEDEVLDDIVNRATNAAEFQQEIKNQIKYHLYGWFGGIIPYCTKSRITEIINKVYKKLLTCPKKFPYFGFNKESNTLELSGCVADLIYSELTEEELDYWYVNRYIPVYKQTYAQALQEVKNGKKETHWMWWIFPQMKGLGKSERSQFYGIPDRNQARAFLEHPYLGKHLIEITQAVFDSDKTPYEIFGADVIKFRLCMKLFTSLENTNKIFKQIINKNHWL
uniref:DUF1810 domain-containing protein n=1 Tax=Alloprevotella sp. TaxID=1872471 RepID=UPI003FEF3E1F